MIHSIIFICMVITVSTVLAESALTYNDIYPLWLPEGAAKSDAKQIIIGDPDNDDLFIVSGGRCEGTGSTLRGNYTIWMLSMDFLADPSTSPVIAEFNLTSSTDYTNQKACAVTWEDTDGSTPFSTMITSGYDRIPDEDILSFELGWNDENFECYGRYENSISTIGDLIDPFVIDAGYIPNWYENRSLVVSGWAISTSEPMGRMAFCTITDLDRSTWHNYVCDDGQDINTMWGWLEVTDENEIYLAGVASGSCGEPFNRLCLGIPYISGGMHLIDYYDVLFDDLSDLNAFRSRIARWTSDGYDYVLIVSNGSSIQNDVDSEETIVAAAWKIDGNGNVSLMGRATYEITGLEFSTDHLFPFALQPYPDSDRALLLLSYHREYSESHGFNLIQAVDITVDEQTGISFNVSSANECSVPLKWENYFFSYDGIHPRDFAFTSYPNEDNDEFAGAGCGTMQDEYDHNENKRIWMFEIERSSTRENLNLDHSNTVQAIRLLNPSSSRIEFQGMPVNGDDIVQVDVYDILGRLVVRDGLTAVGELMRDGIPVDQQGVYYVVISSPDSDFTYTGKTVVLER